MTPLVIVPARMGSQGVPNKNFRVLPDGTTLVSRAVKIATQIGVTVLTTDRPGALWLPEDTGMPHHHILRDRELAQDDTPMRAVVEHVLEQIPGPPDQPIVLLQPTTPLRTVAQVQACLEAMVYVPNHGYRPAATVRATPQSQWRAQRLDDGYVYIPERRQNVEPTYVFSGTAYTWAREDGQFPDAFYAVIEQDQSYVNVDTPEDWAALEQHILTTISPQVP
jgi:CMP-N,N'-diacetyllegionaminic acid synthase